MKNIRYGQEKHHKAQEISFIHKCPWKKPPNCVNNSNKCSIFINQILVVNITNCAKKLKNKDKKTDLKLEIS